MSEDGLTALRDALRAEPPAGIEALAGEDLLELADAIREARLAQGIELRAALDAAYDQIPRLLRGSIRRVLGG